MLRCLWFCWLFSPRHARLEKKLAFLFRLASPSRRSNMARRCQWLFWLFSLALYLALRQVRQLTFDVPALDRRSQSPAFGGSARFVQGPPQVSQRGMITARRFKVTIRTTEGDTAFDCPEDVHILEQAEEEGLDMPSFCRYGDCAACIEVVSGDVDQSEQMFLSEEEMEQGYCITCVGYPTSDVTIQANCRDDVIESKCCFTTPLCEWCPYQGIEGDRPKRQQRTLAR
ncbi:unnamed protein product [Effrenium voratum]|uniref:Ferredoxin n=1 Tax=Effrenium voratum TaxID=2562239 RepID=A0AA36J0M2_9DINO|nr:unnamed protein product [Effrenium voratum]CAJ1426035.1 unnamed protein product [Effrenium voratum]